MAEHSQIKQWPDPDTLDRLADIARELDALAGADAAESDILFQRAQLYHRAAALHTAETAELADFLVRYLMNDCLNLAGDGETSERSMYRHRLRDILTEWLDALPEDTLWHVRSVVIPHAVEQLRLTPSADTLYLLTSMGYRDKTVVSALREVAGGVGGLADTALRLMVGMGVDGDDLAWVREQIESRVAKGCISVELQRAVAILADDSAVDQLCQAGRTEEKNWFIFSQLGWLCDRAPGDLEWQGRVWDAIVALANARIDGWAELLFTGGVIERCHTPRVVETLVTQLPQIISLGQAHFDRLASRVEDLVSLRQIKGAARVDRGAAGGALRQFGVLPTGPNISGMTADARSKEHAWNVALILGIPDLTAWVADAVDNELNTYQQHNFMNIAAVLSLPSLPSSAVSLLSLRNLAFTRGGQESELLPFLGAARLAASCLSSESLRLLLGAEGLMDGHPFRSPVDDTAELAAWMVEHGQTEVLDELMAALRSRRPMACGAATRAVLWLSSSGRTSLPGEMSAALEDISCDDLRPSYVRADAIFARASTGQLSPSFLTRLSDICEHEDEQLRTAAAHALIGAGLLDRHRVAVERCAFHSSGGQVASEPSERLTTYEAYLVGRLAALEPAVYAESSAGIIGSFTLAISETIRAVLDAKRDGLSIPDVVNAAIVQQIREHESPGLANTFLFGALAELDAARLLNEPWEEIWQGWMANSRQALADVLPEAVRRSADPPARERAISLAKALLTDGVFAVRRSGARALGELDQEALRAICEEYLSSGSIMLRERTAEAAGWLPIDAEGTLDNSVLRRLADDSERRVRATARRAREDARRRYWAADHLRVVTGTDSDPNQWVLRRYASGAALANVGDDRDMSAVAARAREAGVPPNVRHWYTRVLKDLERQWKKTTRKWPDPWLPWRGSIEKLHGSFAVGERTYPAQFSLWLLPPAHDRDLASWGGAAYLEGTDALSSLGVLINRDASTGLVRIDGRAEGHAIVVSATGSQVLLSGSGPYPAAVERV